MNDLINQVAAIAQLRKAATPGPWELVVKGNSIQSQAIAGVCSGISMKTGNGAFIAAVGGLDFDSIAAALAATPAAPLLQEAVAADLVALADKLDAMAARADASQVPDASGTDYLRLLVKSRPKLTAGIRALAVSSAGGGVPSEATGEMVQAALNSKAAGEGPTTLEEYLDFSGADTTRRVVKAAIDAALTAAPALPLLVEGAAAGQWVKCDGKADYQAEEDWVHVLMPNNRVEFSIWKEAYWEGEDLWVDEEFNGKMLKTPRFVWAESDGEGCYSTMEPQPTHFQPKPKAPADALR